MKVLNKGYTNKQYAEQAISANKQNMILNIEQDGTVHMEDKPAQKLTYAQLRRQEYGSIEEQLDMIYWDKMNGTTLWKDMITFVKEKYPKNE